MTTKFFLLPNSTDTSCTCVQDRVKVTKYESTREQPGGSLKKKEITERNTKWQKIIIAKLKFRAQKAHQKA